MRPVRTAIRHQHVAGCLVLPVHQTGARGSPASKSAGYQPRLSQLPAMLLSASAVQTLLLVLHLRSHDLSCGHS